MAETGMHVVFFTENIYKGGVDTFLVNLINHWPASQDTLTVICNRSHPGVTVLRDGIRRPCRIIEHDIPLFVDRVLNRQARGDHRTISRLLGRFFRYPLFGSNIFALKRLFGMMRPDRLMVVNGGHPGGDSCRAAITAWRLAFPRGEKAVYNFHNLAVCEKWFDLWFEYPLDCMITRLSSRIITVSRACARSLSIRKYGRLAAKAECIYNGVTMPEPAPEEDGVRRELGIPENAPLSLMLASYEERKGHRFLLRAFRQVVRNLPDAFLVICGYGSRREMDRVNGLVREMGISAAVRVLGFRSDKERFLAATDIVVVPSQAFESFGYTSVEAMIYHKPVVATTVGGIPEVVADGETGYCVDPDDIAGFAKRMVSLLKDGQLRQRMGTAGYQRYAEMFAAGRMSEEYARVIRSL